MNDEKSNNDKKKNSNKKSNNSLLKQLEASTNVMKKMDSFGYFNEMIKKLKFADSLKDQMPIIKALQSADPYRELKESLNDAKFIDPLHELRKSLKNLQITDPLSGLRESMTALRISDPFKEIRESIKIRQRVDPLKGLREAIKTLQFSDPLKEFKASIKTMQIVDPLKELRKSISSIRNSLLHYDIKKNLNDLTQSLDIYRNVFEISIPASYFEQTFQEAVSRIIFTEEDKEMDDVLSTLADEIDKESKKAPWSKLKIEFYIPLIISFIFFIFTMEQNKETEDKIIEQIKNMEKIVTQINEKILESKETETYYIVFRPVNIRLKPTTKKNNILNILYPGQTTRLIERKGKWIKVEYFNHKYGIHESGWCFKKYLRRMKDN